MNFGVPHLKNTERLLSNKFFYPISLLFFSILAHGLLIPFLGFYWDDWPMVWFAETQGPLGFVGAFSGDRPFLSLIYILTTSLLENYPIQWQILGLLSRWILGLTIWWWFRNMWPDKKQQAYWLGILVVIFPGFKQQPISVVYSNGIFLLISYFASYAFMIMAIRSNTKKKALPLYLFSLLTYAFCTLSTEYYIGLDLIRGLVIWFAIKEGQTGFINQIKKTLMIWLPYLLFLAVFLVWRVLIFEFPTYQPVLFESVSSNGVSGAGRLIFRMFKDPLIAGWQAWTTAIKLPEYSDFSITSLVLEWVLILASSLIAWFVLHFLSKSSNQEKTDEVATKGMLFIALAGLFCAGFPFWITGLPIELQYPYDRFLLAFLFSSSLLVVGLLEWLIRKDRQKFIILSLIIGMSIGANFQNANTFRREWITHNQLFWQLSWRVPALTENTILITDNLPFQYYSDNSLTAPLNLLYAPENTSLDLPYYLALIDVRLGRSIPALEKGLEIKQNFRNAIFLGNTSDALVFFYSPPGCLRILDPERDSSLPTLPDEYQDFIHLSNPDRIRTDPDRQHIPSEMLFGSEPEHDWCYYFEHADLERQRGNWAGSVDWINQAFSSGYEPSEPEELIIWIEGNYYIGEWQQAIELTENYFFSYPQMKKSVCEMLFRVNTALPEMAKIKEFQSLQDSTDCLIKE